MDEERRRLEDRQEKQGQDLQILTVQVTKIAGIVENSEQRRGEDLGLIKEALQGIEKLDDKMSIAISLQKDVVQIKETMAEHKADIRVLQHDVRDIKAGAGAIEILTKNIAENKAAIVLNSANIRALEVIRDKATGGAFALGKSAQVFWAIFGTGILGVGAWLIKQVYIAK